MVSQGAQTNGILNGNRKLTKSLSEMGDGRPVCVGTDSSAVSVDDGKSYDHEFLHRTQSEEPPRSPFEATPPSIRSYSVQGQTPHHHSHQHQMNQNLDSCSRTSSRLSQIETSRSEPISSENILTHSRNSSYQSQDSAASFTSQASQDSLYNDNNMIIVTRRGSHVYSNIEPPPKLRDIEPQIHRPTSCGEVQHLQQQQQHQQQQQQPHAYAQPFHSLPRKTCIHYRKEEPQNYTLPRRDVSYAHEELEQKPEIHRYDIFNHDARKPIRSDHIQLRRASCAAITPEIHTAMRRSSVQPQMIHNTHDELMHIHHHVMEPKQQHPIHQQQHQQIQPPTEKEILIDFKPRISPVQSPKSRKKVLQKTLSEGEILLENRVKEPVILASASEDDLVTPDTPPVTKNKYIYRDAPIKDEGIFNIKKFIMEPEVPVGYRTRDSYRKRSVSMEETFLDDDDEDDDEEGHRSSSQTTSREIESNPPSPNRDELSVRVPSTFPSNDSLANDITRDHSDGNWNESQATVLTVEHR